MVEKASSSITINADKAAIMAVIADFEAYPEWSTAIKQVTVDEVGDDGRGTQATFTLDAGVLKDTYTLAYTWSGDDQVEWTLVKGTTMRSQEGSYELAESGGVTEVTYRLAVDLKVPMLGMFKRKAEKMIMDTALKGLKKRVESA
ncbi:MAG: SRPBCC family protein [Frankiaceae bacterium]|nr:SRPBCC family protein [Frankiaceae bacterium]MBV9871079.1 SRPBCC family protein [Frankiaceae bacterium]